MKKHNMVYSVLLIPIFLSILSSCNHPETISISENSLTLPNDSSVIYRLDKRYFMLIPGDTALFYGVKRCSVFTNGALEVQQRERDSLILRTITFAVDTEVIHNKATPVYAQRYEYVSSANELAVNSNYPHNMVTRYFLRNDTAILQIRYTHYEKNNGSIDSSTYFLPITKQKIIPRIIQVGKYGFFQSESTSVPTSNTWLMSPLILHPFYSQSDKVSFDGYCVGKNAIALKFADVPYTINGVEYSNGLTLELFYSIKGRVSEKGRDVHISGTTKILRTYFTDRGMVDQSMIQIIQKSFSDTIQITKEISYIARGPEGAKFYPEHLYP